MKSKLAIALVPFAALALCGFTGMDGFWCDLVGRPPVYHTRNIPPEEIPAYPSHCVGRDTEIADQSQCLAGDAICYQLDNGNWCTNPVSNY